MRVIEAEFCPRAIINHAALRHNLERVRQAAPNSRIWGVIKADAYGHGAVAIARSLTTDGLAVARLDEARRLRRSGEQRPLLIMGGVYTKAALTNAVALKCELVVHDATQATTILTHAHATPPIRIWLKINTGMNRLGMMPAEAEYWLTQLVALYPESQTSLGLMTHLANADNLLDPLTHAQCENIFAFPNAWAYPLSIGNSAGILGWPASRTTWVRPGIMLYGISPFEGETGAERNLRPVMTLKARLIAIKKCLGGAAIGYSGTYVCPETMSIGIIGIGYGDGYPRHAPTGTPVLLDGQRVPIIGRISMDMLAVDLRELPGVRIGTEAILWGDGLPVEEIAKASGTIAYQLVTGVTSRVRRVHIQQIASTT